MSIFSTIEADIKKAWGAVEGEVVTLAHEFWEDVKPVVVSLAPEEYAIVKNAIVGVLQGAQDRSIEEVETALLNAGEQEIALIKKAGSAAIQALIAVVKAA